MATMRVFSRHFVLPLARRLKWKAFCEIGAQYGTNVDEILSLGLENYTVIDPCLDNDLVSKYSIDSRVRVLKCNSLDALATTGPIPVGSAFDCILIDGDHNWYTVFNELKLIHERSLLRSGGYVFLHDVGWPYGRRDLYYQPESIPHEFRQPYAQKGMARGQSELLDVGGINAEFMNALEEGGPRNGVLTAVEDFLTTHGDKYRFCQVHYQCGFGILHNRFGRPSSSLSFYEIRAKAIACELLWPRISAARHALNRRLAS
jgi:hypothetical protein